MSFTGTLAELALCDLVEITTLGAKSGVLEVAHPNGAPAGRLSFRDGALVGAVCGPLVGERAFYALLGLKEGGFIFDPELDLSATRGPRPPSHPRPEVPATQSRRPIPKRGVWMLQSCQNGSLAARVDAERTSGRAVPSRGSPSRS